MAGTAMHDHFRVFGGNDLRIGIGKIIHRLDKNQAAGLCDILCVGTVLRTRDVPATRFLDQPVMASQLLAMDIFNTAKANRMAEAQAMAVILFVALVVVSLIQVSVNKKKEVEL